jgi:hypothetical protein
MFIRTANDCGRSLIAVPDSGFRGEAVRAVREVGPENVTLIRLHKEGCTYYDSRSYISLADLGVIEHDIENIHGKPDVMKAALLDVVMPFARAA